MVAVPCEPVVPYDRLLLLITLCEPGRQYCQAQVLADAVEDHCCLSDTSSLINYCCTYYNYNKLLILTARFYCQMLI